MAEIEEPRVVSANVDQVEVADSRRALRDTSRLGASIDTVGLLNPIVVTESGKLVAGRHRLEAVRRLGWAEIPAIIVEDDDLRNRLAEIDENLMREELTVSERGRALNDRESILESMGLRAKASPGTNQHSEKEVPDTVSGTSESHEQPKQEDAPQTTDDMAGEMGVTGRTARRWQRAADTVVRGVLDELDRMHREEGDETANSTTGLLELGKEDENLQRSALHFYKNGDGSWKPKNISEALKKARRDRKNKERAAKRNALSEDMKGVELPDRLQLIHADFTDALSEHPEGSAGLVFSDPPYDLPSLHLWSDMAHYAGSALRPGGFLLAYSGQSALDQVMRRVGEAADLEYFWCISVPNTHGQLRHWQRKTWNSWKPLLIWRKPGGSDEDWDWFRDVLEVGEKDAKDYHDWSQPMSQASKMIEKFSAPGELVVDPMCGAATIPIAAVLSGRRAIGCEISDEHHDAAKARVSALMEEGAFDSEEAA